MSDERVRIVAYSIVAALACGGSIAHAEPSEEELAKLAQNPVGNLIGLPFQNKRPAPLMFPK